MRTWARRSHQAGDRRRLRPGRHERPDRGGTRRRPRLFGGERPDRRRRAALTARRARRAQRRGHPRAGPRSEPFSADDRAVARLLARQLAEQIVVGRRRHARLDLVAPAGGDPERRGAAHAPHVRGQRHRGAVRRDAARDPVRQRAGPPAGRRRPDAGGGRLPQPRPRPTRARPPTALRIAVGEGLTGSSPQTGRPLLVADVARDPRAVDVPGTPAIGSRSRCCSCPCATRRASSASSRWCRLGLGMFTEDDLRLLGVLADQVAVAIENARLLAGRNRLVEELRALLEIGQAGSVATDELTLATTLARTLRGAARADGCAIVRWDEGGTRLVLLGDRRPGRRPACAARTWRSCAIPAGRAVLLDGPRRTLTVHDLDLGASERAMLEAWGAALGAAAAADRGGPHRGRRGARVGDARVGAGAGRARAVRHDGQPRRGRARERRLLAQLRAGRGHRPGHGRQQPPLPAGAAQAGGGARRAAPAAR